MVLKIFELLKRWVQNQLTWDTAVSLLKAYVLQQRFWTLWFMACLFCLNIFFYMLVKVCKKEWLLVAVSIVLPFAAFAGIFCVVILSKWFVIKPIQYIGENSMIYYAWHQTIMIPVIAKLFSMIGLNALTGYGEVGVVVYKWLSLIGIVLILTVCNWCIGKRVLKFVVGK